MAELFYCRDRTVYDMMDDKYKDLLWGLRIINLEKVWEDLDPDEIRNVKVAIIDSGVEAEHEDLKRAIDEGYNFIEDSKKTNDNYGHGTRVAGVIGAERNNGVGISGAAAGVRIIPLKVCSENGRAKPSNIVKAIEWCIENRIDVVNISLGQNREDIQSLMHPFALDKEERIIDSALKENIIIVSSVGNGCGDSMHFPASHEGVIPVASCGLKLKPMELYLSEKNSRADARTIFAPGEFIYTTSINNNYSYDFGSSIACGFVAAAAALVKARKKKIAASHLQNLLLSASRKFDVGGKVINFLDVGEAFSALLKNKF